MIKYPESEGSRYTLEINQDIQFMHKAKNEATGEFELVQSGTTNEEVIDMLIDRLNILNKKVPCRENSLAITKLEEARMWLYKRTQEREERGVEGTHEK